MQLYVAPGAPNPRRVTMFMVEKGIQGIDLVPVDLNAQEHKGEAYRAKNPLAVIRHLRAAGAGDLKRSARLLVGELGSLLGLRTGLALLGGVILPAAFFGASGDVPFVAQLTVALLSAALLLAGELLERVLFFAAMSAPRMPGVVG